MPSVIDTVVTANYLKARPSTRFSTRQLAFFQINVTDVHVNFEESNSIFSKVVRGVQVVAEIYAIGTPDNDNVIIVVATDTTTGEDELYNTMAQQMSQAINGNLGLGASVYHVALYGDGFLNINGNVTNDDGQNMHDSGDGIEVPTGGTGNQKPPYENEAVSFYD